MNKIAVFASGSGSNFQAIADAVKSGSIQAEIVLLVSDKPESLAVGRARQEGIPVFAFDPKNYDNKREFETEILTELRNRGAELLVLAGYMRLIGEVLLSGYGGNIINLHPSLLPSFPGKDAIGQAVAAGVKVTGVTIHYVDEGMDTGPIIAQEALPVLKEDNAQSLAARIHDIEHKLYPAVISELLEKKYRGDVHGNSTGINKRFG
ncbi:phosphoribosylglycinamide formyltransferase [Bacillus lacus]|uniref:Phosphoribosylglycinamide formyltransferase n=1 Tax=Metabacillus lacus TaxID=1983721 RepID=A0A7X2IZS5_9BACI|nr:phosphoribosylglycinamide formyltransferase [Metabacillus lacus]MRX72659.1 phosphoribosylglycinamide formyltransferase [Metabacillus lacus]